VSEKPCKSVGTGAPVESFRSPMTAEAQERFDIAYAEFTKNAHRYAERTTKWEPAK
jgi:hypothetical protein